MNTEREQAYWDEWDESALRRIIQQQRKITEASKKLEMKKLYQVLVVIDDFADTPQLHKPHGALDTLFIRGRHMQISTWVSSQKLRLISAAVRVNMQFLCCWRLRNQHELDAVIEELSAVTASSPLSFGAEKCAKGLEKRVHVLVAREVELRDIYPQSHSCQHA